MRGRVANPVKSTVLAAPGLSATPDASTTGMLIVEVVGGNAFTIANPVGGATVGQLLHLDLRSSGSQMGTPTWGGLYRLAGTFTRPAANKGRAIAFYWDGTDWRELSRANADT